MDTIAELIKRLQRKANEIGEDTPVVILDDVELWHNDFVKTDDMYCTARVREDTTSTGEKVLLIECGRPCITSIKAAYNKGNE